MGKKIKKIWRSQEIDKKVNHSDNSVSEARQQVKETIRENTRSEKVSFEKPEPDGQKTDRSMSEGIQDVQGDQENFVETDETDTESIETLNSGAEPVKEAIESSALDKLEALTDRYLRLLAEYDNFRKRTEREKEVLVKTASEKLIAEFLPILDNLDRATEHKNNSTTFEEYVKGIVLIEEQIRAVLAREGLESIDVVGQPFDPALHDAVMQIETDEHEPGIVVQEAEKGYVLSGKVIRHPKVVVNKIKQ